MFLYVLLLQEFQEFVAPWRARFPCNDNFSYFDQFGSICYLDSCLYQTITPSFSGYIYTRIKFNHEFRSLAYVSAIMTGVTLSFYSLWYRELFQYAHTKGYKRAESMELPRTLLYLVSKLVHCFSSLLN